MNETIKHTYRDVEIAYIEREDHWNFTVNGRERNAGSLTKAKESIDRSLDHEAKENPWKPFRAYYKRSTSEDFVGVKVTSEADPGWYSTGKYYWVSTENSKGKKERSKESASYLYAVTDENEAAITRWRELDAEIEKLAQEQSDLIEKMAKISPPSE